MDNRPTTEKKKSRTGFSARIIGAIVLSVLIFGAVTGIIGLCIFRYAFLREYDASTRNTALGAAALVDGDEIGAFSGGQEAAGDFSENDLLNEYCRTMDVSRIDVIAVDAGEAGSGRSVFRAVNPDEDAVDAGWEPGQAVEIPGEYKQGYRAVCENGSAYETVRHSDVLKGVFYTVSFVPVRDGSGQVTAVLMMQRSFKPLVDALFYYIIAVIAAAGVFAAVEALISSRYVKKQFVQPVEKISAEAVRFVNEYKAGEPLGGISRIDELSALAGSIDTLEMKMTEYIDDLTAVTAEREKLRTEIDLASRIQNSQIPGTFPAFPDRKEFDIFGSMTPARMIGGDFYNFLLTDDDHLAMWIGDVSGKGIPAALFMMSVNIMLSARVRFGGSPSEILADVNNRICENNEAGMFVTVWLGILEISSGRLTAANGGHEFPFLYQNGRFDMLKDKHGLVLGGLNNSRYKDYEICLVPGDKVFVYSDGVPEAKNGSGEMFRLERLTESLNGHGDGSAEEIVQAVKADLDAFVGGELPFDDITMLSVEYRG